MKWFLSTATATLAAALFVSVAHAAEWENMTAHPAFQKGQGYASVWVKKEVGQNCVIGVYSAGNVEAVIFRGSILKKDLEGQWHLAEYEAPSVEYVKKNGLKVSNMYGSMIVGLEMIDLNAFKRQCGGLPPL